MYFYILFLVLVVSSLSRSSVLTDDICRDGPSPEGLSGRCKRQTTPFQFQSVKCVLPHYPEEGSYTVGGIDNASPGEAYAFVFLNVTCHPGFVVDNEINSIYCYNGYWSAAMPNCVRFCRLSKHDSITYFCPSPDSARGSRECGSVVPTGMIVRPACKTPNYYYLGSLHNMICTGGNWNYIPICKPQCGLSTPESMPLVMGGRPAERGELPWHAGIYSKTTTPYMQICGGSLVSTTIIISAAHCFWSDYNDLLPVSDFAVSVGKIYRPWSNPRDVDAQTSDVADIKITQYFRGSATNFQDDIALVIAATPFSYQVFIRPVCLDFDLVFDSQQLRDNNLGKVAGWGRVASNGNFSQVLKVVELPVVSVEKCYEMSPHSFREFITSDKICAGYTNGTALCQGDSGGGLAFPAEERGVRRYFLRGVVSTAPKNKDLCSTNALTAFTRIAKHEDLIKNFVYATSPELSSVASNSICPTSQWQCQDGSMCIPLDNKCDGMVDCPDDSDEADCDTQPQPQCVLPPTPEHGSYTVEGDAHASPGQARPSAALRVSCDTGYILEYARRSLDCRDGVWSYVMPKCVRFCRLPKHASVEYRCPIAGSAVASRKCGPRVPTGTIVEPVCRAPVYTSDALKAMECVNGTWDHIARCRPECGTISPEGMTLSWRKKTAHRGELPWHAGVYMKIKTDMPICSGSLVTTKTVISAATCFWQPFHKFQRASNFAVAVGKIHRQWTHPGDPDAQKSNIARIVVPSIFRGKDDDYKNNIAVVIVVTAFTYQAYIRPVCLDFDIYFEKQQLQDYNVGKVAGWARVSEYGNFSEELKVVDIEYINREKCITLSVPIFSEHELASDKICAGYTNGSVACDEVGFEAHASGLAFPANKSGVQRYYLRGVYSSPLGGMNSCLLNEVALFTQITKHELFIKNNIR